MLAVWIVPAGLMRVTMLGAVVASLAVAAVLGLCLFLPARMLALGHALMGRRLSP